MLLVCVATATEGALLERRLAGPDRRIAGRPVVVARTGVGPVNAAHVATLHLARGGFDAVVACGVGGAYPGSGLEIGAVVCAEAEVYGDLGAESAEGFLDMERLGFPVVEGDRPLFNRLPLDLFPVARRAVFVTRSACTGTDAAAHSLVARTGGAVESMEGAAVVHVARRLGVPVGEVRAISNRAGDRDRAGWRVGEAAHAAQEALLAWIEEGGA